MGERTKTRTPTPQNYHRNITSDRGRYETLRSLGDLLQFDIELLKKSHNRSLNGDCVDHQYNRRTSVKEYLRRVQDTDRTNDFDANPKNNDGMSRENSAGSFGVKKRPLPDIVSVNYKDVYEVPGSGNDSDHEGVVTIMPFVDIRKARVTSRGRSRLQESLKELRDKISRFDSEHKYRKSVHDDEFQHFLGNLYLDLYDRRHGIVLPENKTPKLFDRIDRATLFHQRIEDTGYTSDQSHSLNAKIHALARSKQQSLIINKVHAANKLPPINGGGESHAEGYDSSPEVTSHRDVEHVNARDIPTSKSAHLAAPLHTAIRAQKRFPQQEKYRELLHELRKLSSIVQKVERNN